VVVDSWRGKQMSLRCPEEKVVQETEPILIVEDDKIDIITIQHAIEKLSITNPIYLVTNGEEALEFLRDPLYPQPGLIILDLNMPRMGGIEFLRHKKDDPEIKNIPVVVLTTSDEEKDILDTYELCAKGYMVKPTEYLKFVEVVRAINLYWTLSKAPSIKNNG